MAATAFYAGFAGPDPDAGRRIAKLQSWGAGEADEHWRAASPWRQQNLPQIRLEPILKARSRELSPGRIRFNHELIGLTRRRRGDRDVRDNRDRRIYEVRAEYLLGADGGRTVPAQIGVEYEGPRRGHGDGRPSTSAPTSPSWPRTPTSSSAGSSRRRAAHAS